MIQKYNDGCLLFCDGCEKQMPVYDELYAVFQWYWHNDTDGSLIRETAMNSNWQITQDSDLCPDCWNDSSLMEVEDEN